MLLSMSRPTVTVKAVHIYPAAVPGTWSLLQVQASNAPDLPVEAILITHRDTTSPRPSVLMPHGGPHSCYPASYFSGYTFLVSLGYSLVLVNFRGSTGFGEDSIQSLPGNIATNDVLDCMACLQAAIDTGTCLHSHARYCVRQAMHSVALVHIAVAS